MFRNGGTGRAACSTGPQTAQRMSQLAPLHLAAQLLNGDVDGNEMRAHVVWYNRWAYPRLAERDYRRLLRRLATSLDWYISSPEPFYPKWSLYFWIVVLLLLLSLGFSLTSDSILSNSWMLVYLIWLWPGIAPLYDTDGHALLTQLESELTAESQQ